MLKDKIIAIALLLSLCASASSLVSCTSNVGNGDGTPSASNSEKATEKSDTDITSSTSIADSLETNDSRIMIVPNGK